MKHKILKVVMLISCVAVLFVSFAVPTFADADPLGDLSDLFVKDDYPLVGTALANNIRQQAVTAYRFTAGENRIFDDTNLKDGRDRALEATRVIVDLKVKGQSVNQMYALNSCKLYWMGDSTAYEWGWDFNAYVPDANGNLKKSDGFYLKCRYNGGDHSNTNVKFYYYQNNDPLEIEEVAIYLVSNHSSIQDMALNRFFNFCGFDNDVYDRGFDAGYGNGFNDGFETGEGTGYEHGEMAGREEGYNEGFAEGKKVGETEALNESDTFKDMVFAIFEAPGRLIDGMLDFNLLGINVASLVKTLLTLGVTALILYFIFKLVKG